MQAIQRQTRRGFVQCIGETSLAAGLMCVARGKVLARETGDESPASDRKRFKKAVKIGMVRVDASLTEKFRLLKELGFDGVELNSPGGPTADEAKQAVAASGLPVHGVVDSAHWRQSLSHPDAQVRSRGVAALKTAIRMANAYGGSSVLLVPGVVNKDVSYQQAWKRSTAEIEKVLPLAEEEGIDVLLENVWNNFLTDPDKTARYIDQFQSPRLGAYYDVGNSVRYAPPAQWIDTLGKRIKKLDIKEYDLNKGRREGWYAGFRVKLLEGSCNWPLVMKKLREIGFSGWGTAEIPGGGRGRMSEIARRMDRIFAS